MKKTFSKSHFGNYTVAMQKAASRDHALRGASLIFQSNKTPYFQ